MSSAWARWQKESTANQFLLGDLRRIGVQFPSRVVVAGAALSTPRLLANAKHSLAAKALTLGGQPFFSRVSLSRHVQRHRCHGRYGNYYLRLNHWMTLCLFWVPSVIHHFNSRDLKDFSRCVNMLETCFFTRLQHELLKYCTETTCGGDCPPLLLVT